MNDATSAPDATGPTTDFATKAAQLKCMFEELCACAPSAASTAASDAACQAKAKAMEAGRKVIDTVRRHPVESAAIAIGTGLLVWWLVNRRSTSDE